RTAHVRLLRWVVGLVCIATAAPAQVSYQQQQPTEKLLVLPLMVKSPGDSAFSIAVMDVAREKLGQMARYKVQVIPKPKLCEALTQRLNSLVRAAEQARECDEQRKKSQFPKALDAARKALATEPNLPAAHICVATVYEAQHMPLDSLVAAYQRAAKGDSLNAT